MGENEKEPAEADGSLSDEELDGASGGARSVKAVFANTQGGVSSVESCRSPQDPPVPIPYPNVSTADKDLPLQEVVIPIGERVR
jgi:hypothetical protein